jgi:hypothetical protein
MNRNVWIHVLAALSVVAVEARGEVAATVGRNASGASFKFDAVPVPSKSDAASKAKVTLVDGTRDRSGGDVTVLTDGLVPRVDDQPRANFFFAAGSDGGRILLDLGEATDVKQGNTYSWHPAARGPQVYTLYGSDGSAAGFDTQPKRPADPEKAGWKKLASVDTRPQGREPGGQFGVAVADTAGNLGKFRYLLFDVSPADRQGGMGNTFYSEIDVVDVAAKGELVAATPAPERGGGGGRVMWEATGPVDPNGPAPTVAKTEAGDEITFDYSQAPELKDWVENTLKPDCVKWYPIIVGMLPSEGYQAPKKFSVVFRNDYRGVAATGGTRVVCAIDWFSKNLKGEAAGAVVHELVHVVQQYRGARGGNRNPGWLVEGLADWLRWFNYEPESARPHPRPDRANYNDSYRTTGHFLDYVVKKYDKDLIKKLNAAMREGKYTDQIWKDSTGKTLEELGQEWKQSLAAT